MVDEFQYLADKVAHARFCGEPFPHVTVTDFLDRQHFHELLNSYQIVLPRAENTRQLLDHLRAAHWEAIDFPGCTTRESVYLAYIDRGQFSRRNIAGYGRRTISSLGMTFRLAAKSGFLQELMEFLESPQFIGALCNKFSLPEDLSYDGGIQKNLRGYQISPHPDTSRKALTWMVNINSHPGAQAQLDMHTHLLEFTDQYRYIYDFWEFNDVDPVWVPWSWTRTSKLLSINNSITVFQPSSRSLHAVRVTEDHLIHQRNQIYGNLWYEQPVKSGTCDIQKLDLLRHESRLETTLRKLRPIH